jgi:polysaccharide biosynthesis protein PelE
MHMPPITTDPLRPASPRRVLGQLGVALAFAAAGIGLARLALAGGVAAWAALAGHVLATTVAVWLARRACDPRGARSLWLLAIGFGGLGTIGAMGSALTLLLGLAYDRRATPLDEWQRALFPEAEADPDAELWAVIGTREAAGHPSVAPFVDVRDHGSLSQKQAVVALIARNFRPAFAPALRRALRDQQNVVRVQAATAVTMIEAQATAAAYELERHRRERPDDPSLLLRVARHEDGYAFTGLLDPARERESRERAVSAFREYLDVRPGDVAAWHQLGRLFARLGCHEDALSCLRQALHHGGGAQTRLWTMECLFHLRRFPELRQLVEESAGPMTAEISELPLETPHVLQMWGRGGATVP